MSLDKYWCYNDSTLKKLISDGWVSGTDVVNIHKCWSLKDPDNDRMFEATDSYASATAESASFASESSSQASGSYCLRGTCMDWDGSTKAWTGSPVNCYDTCKS
jgi:hypothetical protein